MCHVGGRDMYVVAFLLTVNWGCYTVDFDEGEPIRDTEGNYLKDGYDDAECEEQVESCSGIIDTGTFDTEEEIEERRLQLAEIQDVHEHRITVLYLDPTREANVA
jgi:hypothetical protein